MFADSAGRRNAAAFAGSRLKHGAFQMTLLWIATSSDPLALRGRVQIGGLMRPSVSPRHAGSALA